ncbi:glutathione S-transferase family protein [Aspergillus stella-maris]|uniref:glutathione S-transferase family protein n=1 Tax=Aspergillus stella-maris TaxID=1810926 RepID=UPI003CCDF115
MEPITVWMTPSGPNPWKVVIVIKELGLPYKVTSFKFEEVKKPPFININPNGRVPAIEDPNTQITLWESGAIIQYLIEQYDKDHKLSYGTLRERQLCNQWLHFQMSGQGPYYGQCAWFKVLHHESIPSAIERYTKEIHRILGVLNGVLEGKTWLVGDKMTFADLAFLPWHERIDQLLSIPRDEALRQYPNVLAWHTRMRTLETWVDCEAERARLMGEQGLGINGLPKGVDNMEEFQKLMAEGKLK